MLARTVDPGQANGFPLLGASALPVVTATDTGGAWEVLVLDLGAEAASPLHTLTADKLFFVVDGEVTVQLEESVAPLTAGGFAHVPAGTAHRYQNRSGAPARMLVVTGGADQVAFLRGMSELTANGKPDPEALAAHTAAHGVRILPPTAPSPVTA